MRIKLKVHEKSGQAYFPDELRNEGYVGELDALPNHFSLVIIRPGSTLQEVKRSLEIISQDLQNQIDSEERKHKENPNGQ